MVSALTGFDFLSNVVPDLSSPRSLISTQAYFVGDVNNFVAVF